MFNLITTIVAFGLMLGVPLAWDVVLATTGEQTISEVFRNFAHKHSAGMIFGVSVMPGHWFVNFDQSLVEMAGGDAVGELAVIVWLAWTLQWTLYGHELGPWASLALVIFGVLSGALLWTMDPVA